MHLSTLLIFLLVLTAAASSEISCKPGSYRSGDTCKLCPKGKFQDKPNQTSCEFCDDNFVSTEPGATACVECNGENEVAQIDGTACKCVLFTTRRPDGTCKKCPNGELPFIFFDPPGCETCGFTRCIKCKPGEILVRRDRCGKCPPGKTKFEGVNGCVACEPGLFKAGVGQQDCIKCPRSTFSGRGASRCIRCPRGKALMKNGKCRSCKRGQFFEASLRKCLDCHPRFFRGRKGAWLRCRRCPKGKFSASGATKCVTCPPGTVLLRDETCGNCPPGTRYVPFSLFCGPK